MLDRGKPTRRINPLRSLGGFRLDWAGVWLMFLFERLFFIFHNFKIFEFLFARYQSNLSISAQNSPLVFSLTISHLVDQPVCQL